MIFKYRYFLAVCLFTILLSFVSCEIKDTDDDDNGHGSVKRHELLWKVELAGWTGHIIPVVLEDATIIAHDIFLEKRSIFNGDLIWQVDLGVGVASRSINSLIIDNTVVLYAGGFIFSIAVDNGEILSSIQLENYFKTGTQKISYMNGKVYIGGINTIAIVDIANQSYEIRDINVFFNDNQRRYVDLVSVDPTRNQVILPTGFWDEEDEVGYGEVVCFNSDLTEIRWLVKEPNELLFPDGNTYTVDNACVTGIIDGDIFYYDTQFTVKAISAINGDSLWCNVVPGAIFSTSPGLYRDRVFIGCQDGTVACYNAGDGVMQWETSIDYTILTTLSFYDNEMFICSLYSGDMHIFNIYTGSIVFDSRQEENMNEEIITPVGVGYGYSVVQGEDYVYCHKIIEEE